MVLAASPLEPPFSFLKTIVHSFGLLAQQLVMFQGLGLKAKSDMGFAVRVPKLWNSIEKKI